MKRCIIVILLMSVGSIFPGESSLKKRDSLAGLEQIPLLHEEKLVEISKLLDEINLVQKLIGEPFHYGKKGEVKQMLEGCGIMLEGKTDGEVFWGAFDVLRGLEEQQRQQMNEDLQGVQVELDPCNPCCVKIGKLEPAKVLKALFDYAKPLRDK